VSPDKDTLIALGQISKPRGLSGEVIVRTYQFQSQSFTADLSVVVIVNEKRHVLQIETSKPASHRLCIKFKGVDDRNQAEELAGGEIYCKFGKLPKKTEGEFFVFDIIGLEVINKAGAKYGKVRDLISMPGNDVIEIGYEDHEIIVPFSENIVNEVNLKEKFIRIDKIEDFILE